MKSRLRAILLALSPQMGVFAGVPMRPDEIEELMRCVSQPKIVYTVPGESEKGEPERPD